MHVTIDSLLTAAGEELRAAERETDPERKTRKEERAYNCTKQALERLELRRDAAMRAEFHKGSGSVYDVES